jgi:hypothetical protein
MFRNPFKRQKPGTAPASAQPSSQTRLGPQPVTPKFGWGKFFLFIFIVLLPAVAVVIANQLVFPESSWIATIMVLVSVGVAFVFTIASGKATGRTQRYVLLAHLFLCLVLSANLCGHWVLARELSGARQATEARHLEEDREEARKEAAARRAADLIRAQSGLESVQSRRFANEAWRNREARRLGMTAPRNSFVPPMSNSLVPSPATEALASTTQPQVRPNALTGNSAVNVSDIMAKWQPRLMIFAMLDLLAAVIGGALLITFWEWDRNKNGIPDHLEHEFVRP